MLAHLRSWRRDERGQSLTEYALLLALVAIGLIGILALMRNGVGNAFNGSRNSVTAAGVGPGYGVSGGGGGNGGGNNGGGNNGGGGNGGGNNGGGNGGGGNGGGNGKGN